MHTFQVIIVGAGISGLSAARTLMQNGIDDILILEAKEKVGGRISSLAFGDSLVELGAQWIHGEDNELFDLIKTSAHLHDKSSWEGEGDFLTPKGEHLEDNVVAEINDWTESELEFVEDNFAIETFQDKPNEWEPNVSMGSHLRKRFQDYLDKSSSNLTSKEIQKVKPAVFQWGMSFQRIDNSCNHMGELSLFRWSEYKSNGTHVYRNFQRGAQNFADEILVGSSLKSKIRLATPVVSIDWSDSAVKVATGETPTNSELFQCESVLVTCSVGVLRETKDNMFKPPLPKQLANAFESTGFGPVTKIFLEWEKGWWTDDFLGVQFTWPDDYIDCCDVDAEENRDFSSTWYKAMTGFDPVLDNPNVLLTWLGGPEAIYVETLSESDVGNICAKLLRQFTGNPSIPPPKSVRRSNWNSDPYFRGAYSFRSKKGDTIPGSITDVLNEPVCRVEKGGQTKIKLIFAGEALHTEYYSTLHGAFESGRSQAEKIIKYYKTKD